MNLIVVNMSILQNIVFIPSYLSGLVFGLLFSRIFVHITKNNRFRLTSVGTAVFGKDTGFKSQFINGIKGTILVILDLIIILTIGNLIEKFVSKIMTTNSSLYFPFF